MTGIKYFLYFVPCTQLHFCMMWGTEKTCADNKTMFC